MERTKKARNPECRRRRSVNRLRRWGTFDGRQRLTNKLSTARRHSPRNRRFYMTGCWMNMPADTRNMPTSAAGCCDSSPPFIPFSTVSRPTLASKTLFLLLSFPIRSDFFLECTSSVERHRVPFGDEEQQAEGYDIFTGITTEEGKRVSPMRGGERLLTINYGIFLTAERIAIFSDVGNRPGYNSFDKF